MSKGSLAVAAAVLLLTAGTASAQRVDIFTALREGTVVAEFHGNGDASVVGTITRLPGGPTEVVIPIGSIFRVARAETGSGWDQWRGGGYGGRGYGGGYGGRYGGGYSGRGGRYGQGGRQGMYGMQSTTTRLAFNNTARVVIPAVCMNYDKPAPRPSDLMVILPPDRPELTRLAEVLEEESYPQPAVQVAMWAVVNHAPRRAGERYLQLIIPGRHPAILRQREELMQLARELVEKIGVA